MDKKADFEARRKVADEKIAAILKENEVAVVALPAFTEMRDSVGMCTAIGIIQYRDLKKYDDNKEVEKPVENK